MFRKPTMLSISSSPMILKEYSQISIFLFNSLIFIILKDNILYIDNSFISLTPIFRWLVLEVRLLDPMCPKTRRYPAAAVSLNTFSTNTG